MEAQERIIIKAHELYMRYGIRSVSMDEIATQLGMSKKTIYQYYPDKEAVVQGVVEIEINKNSQKCTNFRKESENAVHEFFLELAFGMEMLKTMNTSILFDLEKYHPKAYKKFVDHKNKFMYESSFNNLERGKAEGLYRSEINSELIARFRVISKFLIFNPELFPQNNIQDISIAMTSISENFIYGVTTPEGQELIKQYQQQLLNK